MNLVLVAANANGLEKEFFWALTTFFRQHKLIVKKSEALSPGKVEKILVTTDAVDEEKLRADLILLSDTNRTDVALIPEELFEKPKKLIIFDMDSTLIPHEVIDEMAAAYGIGDQVKEITKRAMNGELNFDESLHARVGLLKGLTHDKLDEVRKTLTLMPGALEVIRACKAQGAKTVIASGGFTFFAEDIRTRLEIDQSFANELEVEANVLTGKVSSQVVNADYKATLLRKLAKEMNLDLSEVVAVGDGANDIPMLLTAGLGFAFHAKDKVRRTAKHQLQHGTMHTLLYFLNVPGEHFA